MPDYDGNLVVMTGGTYKGKASFINGATDGGTITVSDAFGGVIETGDKFAIFGIKGASGTTIGHKVSSMEFWSVANAALDLPAVAANVNCSNIVVSDLPAGATVIKALGALQFRAVENPNAGGNNGIKGAQNIRISDDDWASSEAFLLLVDDQFLLDASTKEGGGIFTADDASDCKATVTGNGTYKVRFEDALVDFATLTFHDLKVGLKIWFT